MTSPAQTSRRQFIGGLGCALAAGAFAGVAPRLLASAGNRTTEPRALILIQLEGGHDGLSTFVPVHDDRYYRLRPNLALARREVIALGETVGLHRAGRGFESLFKDGQLAVVENVGYANQSPSHFRSTEVWHTASEADQVLRAGWLGRCVAQMESASRSVAAFHGGNIAPRVFTREEGPTCSRRLALGADAITQLAGISERVATTAGTELYFVSVPGFDTHFDQREQHAARLHAVSTALQALQQRLKDRGVADRVLTMAFSEFGRSAGENAQGGTDHGSGSPVLLLGASVRGGFYNDRASLVSANPAPLDFRRVQATITDQWLNVPPAAVLGRSFAPLDLITRTG